jgi:hypothetical protein
MGQVQGFIDRLLSLCKGLLELESMKWSIFGGGSNAARNIVFAHGSVFDFLHQHPEKLSASPDYRRMSQSNPSTSSYAQLSKWSLFPHVTKRRASLGRDYHDVVALIVSLSLGGIVQPLRLFQDSVFPLFKNIEAILFRRQGLTDVLEKTLETCVLPSSQWPVR